MGQHNDGTEMSILTEPYLPYGYLLQVKAVYFQNDSAFS